MGITEDNERFVAVEVDGLKYLDKLSGAIKNTKDILIESQLTAIREETYRNLNLTLERIKYGLDLDVCFDAIYETEEKLKALEFPNKKEILDFLYVWKTQIEKAEYIIKTV